MNSVSRGKRPVIREKAIETLEIEADAVLKLKDRIDDAFEAAGRLYPARAALFVIAVAVVGYCDL